MDVNSLETLARLLEADAANPKGLKFDINCVVEYPDEDMNTLPKDWQPKIDCGTIGCAMGLAALSGVFPRLSYTFEEEIFTIKLDGQDQWYDRAGAELFDITRKQANRLFSPDYYDWDKQRGVAGELAVAARIRQLIADGHLEGIQYGKDAGDEDEDED